LFELIAIPELKQPPPWLVKGLQREPAILVGAAGWTVAPNVVPNGYVFGVWQITGIKKLDNEHFVLVQGDDTPEIEALRRAFVGGLIPIHPVPGHVFFDLSTNEVGFGSEKPAPPNTSD
jgi:hypothetical protein